MREALDVEPAAAVRGFIAAVYGAAAATMPASMTDCPHALILASTSRYRRELLDRLRLPFEVHGAAASTKAPLARRSPGRSWRAGWRWPRRAPWRRSTPTRW